MLGTLFAIISKMEKSKLKRLKDEGLRYDAKIEQIVSHLHWIRIGSYRSVYAECSYRNSEGKICLVKSTSFLLEKAPPTYEISVYVSRNDPMDYSVEINVSREIGGSFDYDYRKK